MLKLKALLRQALYSLLCLLLGVTAVGYLQQNTYGYGYEEPYAQGGQGGSWQVYKPHGGQGGSWQVYKPQGGQGGSWQVYKPQGGQGGSWQVYKPQGGQGGSWQVYKPHGGYGGSEVYQRKGGFFGAPPARTGFDYDVKAGAINQVFYPDSSLIAQGILDENGVPNIETMRNLELVDKQRVIQSARRLKEKESRERWNRENRQREVQSIYRDMRLKNPVPGRKLNSRDQTEALRSEVIYLRNRPRSSSGKFRVNPSVTNIDRIDENRR